MKNNINLSNLKHTWIFDLDGTLVCHNGHLTENGDCLLPGVKDFFSKISNDYVIILTARKQKYKKKTEMFLKKNNIKTHPATSRVHYKTTVSQFRLQYKRQMCNSPCGKSGWGKGKYRLYCRFLS